MTTDQSGPVRWVLIILIVAAIIGLVSLARGEPDRGGPRIALVTVERRAG